MRPTDFCFPSLCRRAPAPRRFPIRVRFYPTASGGKDASRHPCPLRWAARLLSMRGVFFPAPRRRDRTSDTPSLTGLPRDRGALFLRRTTPLPAGLDRFFRLPRDGNAAPSTRGAFHRQVPEPSARAPFPTPSRDPCFPDPAALHTATRFSTPLRSRRPPLFAFAIDEDPPLARPRPRELVVRLEEDPAHASLGQAPPDDFCNTTYDARAHPTSSRSSPVNCERPEASFSPTLARRRRTHVTHRAFCFRRAPRALVRTRGQPDESEPREPR